MPNKRALLRIFLERKLLNDFKAICAKDGVTMSDAIRRHMLAVIKSGE